MLTSALHGTYLALIIGGLALHYISARKMHASDSFWAHLFGSIGIVFSICWMFWWAAKLPDMMCVWSLLAIFVLMLAIHAFLWLFGPRSRVRHIEVYGNPSPLS